MSENVRFEIVENNEKSLQVVMGLLHEYPNHFVQGLFEAVAVEDFWKSDIMIAFDGEQPIGCIMLDAKTKEFNWLAVTRSTIRKRAVIARQLFESFCSFFPPGTEYVFCVNTEDATVPGHPHFSGANFDPARTLYRAMGLVMNQENRREDWYGPGAHVYQVRWVPK